MWTSFFKAFFVLGAVMGVEEIFFGIYLRLKQKRINSMRWLLRGISSVIVFSFSLWFFQGRSLDLDDLEILATTALPLLLATFGIEAYLKVRGEGKPLSSLFEKPAPEGATTWIETRKMGKARFVAGISFVCGFFFLAPGVVFSIVAPELLRPYWWPIIILSFTIIGFVLGTVQWSANEKRFLSKG
jgi:hypothetical protein